jgi:hypothetical protein
MVPHMLRFQEVLFHFEGVELFGALIQKIFHYRADKHLTA